jgi:hypothetical protein
MKLKNSLKYYYFPHSFEIKTFRKLIKLQNISVIVDTNNNNEYKKINPFVKDCKNFMMFDYSINEYLSLTI